MKYIYKLDGTFLLLFLVTMFMFSACKSTSMQGSEKVQSTMQTVDNDIKLSIVQIDAIGASLDELIKPGQADRKKALDVFSDNVSKINKMQKDFSKHAAEMEASGKAYFAAWDKDAQKYDNPEIQIQSNQRREELARTYDKIALNNIGIKSAFQTYVSDVNEIEQFISNDLTSAGMESITRISTKVVGNGSRLKNELASLQSAIEEAREKMKSN